MMLRLVFYAALFILGWQWGMAQAGWHKWLVGSAAAYMAGAAIRMLWA